jgi:hypothetical protein
MKASHLITALFLASTSAAFAADGHDHGHEHKSLHGGIVTEVKDMDYEFVAKTDVLQLYLRDHGKAVDVSNANAKATLLTGSEKQEIELKPTGDKLEAKGSFKVAAGTKAVVLVNLPGKPAATARFVVK